MIRVSHVKPSYVNQVWLFPFNKFILKFKGHLFNIYRSRSKTLGIFFWDINPYWAGALG